MPMQINAKLFANILLDPFLKGNAGLQGFDSASSGMYLKEYMDSLPKKELPFGYEQLSVELGFLNKIDRNLGHNTVEECTAEVLQKLETDGQVLIPGGWHTVSEDGSIGGHSMIYEIRRLPKPATEPQEYQFSVIHAGAGVDEHAQKSGAEKELYNPMRAWVFPKNDNKKPELGRFIKRLLSARCLNAKKHDKTFMDADGIYWEVIPSISRLNAREFRC